MKPFRPEAPELLKVKNGLSRATRIDPIMLANWIRANIMWLRGCASDVSNDHPDYQDEAYAWLRIQFIERALNSQPARVPTITKTDCPRNGSEPAGSLTAYMFELARRKLL
jgi:hypothetical protein